MPVSELIPSCSPVCTFGLKTPLSLSRAALTRAAESPDRPSASPSSPSRHQTKAKELSHGDGGYNPHCSLLPTYTTTVCPRPGVQTKVLHADHCHRSLGSGGRLTHAACCHSAHQTKQGQQEGRGRSHRSPAEAAVDTRSALAPPLSHSASGCQDMINAGRWRLFSTPMHQLQPRCH